MRRRNLEPYIKVKPEPREIIVTSVNIDKRHMAFLKRLNLNLSRLVRDLIDDLIKEQGDDKP